jgi:hypothetical protein
MALIDFAGAALVAIADGGTAASVATVVLRFGSQTLTIRK